MSSPLQSELYVFDPRPQYPLLITAKRYWHPAHCPADPDALTLVFAHGTGFHKESWEPTLEHLYDALLASPQRVKIREAWSIDAPNHGDAAVLNEKTLDWGYLPVVRWEEYARSVHAFLTGLGSGIPVDFRTRNLVAIGHSMGAIAMMLADTYKPDLKFRSLILVDPMLVRKPEPGTFSLDLAAPTAKRRDVWASRADALKSLQQRPASAAWDPRVLELYVEHAMRDLPTLTYPDKTEGVTLKCSRDQEAATYRDPQGYTRAYSYLHHLCTILPVHIIYGGIHDYLPKFIHDDVLKVAAQGKYATVATVAGAGHLIPQMQPKGLANAILAALVHDATDTSTKDVSSRL